MKTNLENKSNCEQWEVYKNKMSITRINITNVLFVSMISMISMIFISCSDTTSESINSNNSENELTGTVEIDGSSTVYPVSEAVAEEFNKLHPKVRVNVGVSGTGGGFKRFTKGEIEQSK